MEPGELLFGPATDPSQVSAALSAHYRVRVERVGAQRWTCLDTADWRLHRAGMTLRDARRARRRELLLTVRGDRAISAAAARVRWPGSVASLPSSPVRERIERPVGMRALLPLAEVDVQSLGFSLLDDDEKTRVRVRVDQQRLAGDRAAALPLRVVITPVRGYERDGRRCAAMLDDAMRTTGDVDTAATAAMVAAGHRPGEPMVAALILNPAAPARASLAAVLRRWSDVIDANRAGVLDDIDIEYLHEMRTAVRGTRSLLSFVPDLFSAEQVQGAAREFAWLGRLTTPLRDLDVTMRELAADLARDPDLEPLRAHFAALRRRALQDVRAGLQSPRGVALTASWRVALDRVARDEAAGGGMAGVDVSSDDVSSDDVSSDDVSSDDVFGADVSSDEVSGDDVSAHEVPSARTRRVAGELALAAYRAIVKSAATVSAQTPADELHRLRRRCKRMRYLLDGYASVYPRESHREVLGALTALQDCLGDIQDVDVRRQQLAVAASALADGRLARTAARPAEALLAIGAVRERRLMIDGAARRSLVKRLARFRGTAIQQCVGELAGAPRSGAPA